MIRSQVVDSLPGYIEAVCRVRDSWVKDGPFFEPWFRGVSDKSWKLLPSLYRLDLGADEEEIRADFLIRGPHLTLEREPQSEWEWYFLMQHYRAPTRLLDWSTGALVALFFAINSYTPGAHVVDRDAAVWVLDPAWLNKHVLKNDSIVWPTWPEARPYLPRLYNGPKLRRRLPIAIEPAHVARRVAVQRSRFTIHGTQTKGLELVAARPRSRLLRIDIASTAIERMRTDLLTCGYSDTTIFPDLDGLGREVARFHSDPA